MRLLAPAFLILAVSCAAIYAGREETPRNDDSAEPLRTRPMSAPTRPDPHSDDAYEAHIEKLRERLPHEAFTIVIEKPFVVVGDEAPSMVRLRATRTVRWATVLLEKDFFDRKPDHILDVWLFKDRRSYEKHAEELFGSKPGTPFGYYSPVDAALVMNISTGGGTLVHEIVHPFMAANFPECPSWFNEGMGSLFEQCHERDGKILGLTNWRLQGLQEAIRADRLPTFEALSATTTREFYDEDPGTNYSQSRYLLYYLQERGLLRKYYREFRAAQETDPTGYETLKAILEEEDMEAFQKRWEQYVLRLKFRG